MKLEKFNRDSSDLIFFYTKNDSKASEKFLPDENRRNRVYSNFNIVLQKKEKWVKNFERKIKNINFLGIKKLLVKEDIFYKNMNKILTFLFWLDIFLKNSLFFAKFRVFIKSLTFLYKKIHLLRKNI